MVEPAVKLQPGEWSAVLRLLDEALALPVPERPAWLDALDLAPPRLKDALRGLLEDRRAIETGQFLQALPPLAPAAAALHFGVGHRIGPYALLRELGHGGMASVWLAERADGAHGREVALKLPYLGARSHVVGERFARERQFLSALTHPNIAGVLDAGFDGAQPWLAMEYVDGRPITDWAHAQSLGVSARLRLFVQVVRAVQHAHAQLVIHRDIKPSNVLVDANGQAKLLDFGVAKLMGDDGATTETELTQLGGRALTPQYASPEQLAGQTLGVTSDVYALGVLLHELLTGRLPYTVKRATPAALEEAILAAQTGRASAFAPDAATRRALQGDLDTVIAKALALRPADRYGSAEALAQDIERHLQSLPILARPASPGYLLCRWVQRHALAFGAGVAVVGALAAGLGVALWQARAAQHESARAQATRDFLVGMFKAADLDQDDALRKRQQTVQQLLESSAAKLETELQDQPALRADLQGVAGTLLHDLAVSEAALKVRSQRVTLLATLRADANEQAQALLDEAQTLVQLGRNDAAEQSLAKALAQVAVRTDSAALALRAAILSAQAERRLKSGVAAKAEPLLDEALALARRAGMPAPLLAQTLARLGELRVMQSRNSEAMAAYDESIAVWQRALGTRSPALARVRYQLGEDLWGLGRVREAEQQSAEAVATMRERVGPEHVQTALMEVNLGRMRSLLGAGSEGRALLLHAVAVLQAHADDVSATRRVDALMFLGESYLVTGELAAAGPLLRQAVALEQQHPESAPADGSAQVLLSRYETEVGHSDAALALLTAVRLRRVEAYGADHPSVLDIDHRIALVRDHQGRLDEAQRLYTEVLAASERGGERFAGLAEETRQSLVGLQLDRGEFAQALPAIEKETTAFYAQPAADRNRAVEMSVSMRRGRALAGVGRLAEARADLERAVAIARQDHHPTSHVLAMARGRLALCLIALDELAGAAREVGLAEAALRAQPSVGRVYREPAEDARLALVRKQQPGSSTNPPHRSQPGEPR